MKREGIEDPRMDKLAECLRVSKAQAVGIIEMLIHWDVWLKEYLLTKSLTDTDLARAATYDGSPEFLGFALVHSGWVKETGSDRFAALEAIDNRDDYDDEQV